ncbi:iron ABC transporter permease [Babesia caballi]|uniref:Iron ABC transporter permease n=1 Tax=Babesia caballi TaxID=5871 RepID=A0AAV4LQE7_BABCB|nr:iron ABC transporter permease [Babesia caballi]
MPVWRTDGDGQLSPDAGRWRLGLLGIGGSAGRRLAHLRFRLGLQSVLSVVTQTEGKFVTEYCLEGYSGYRRQWIGIVRVRHERQVAQSNDRRLAGPQHSLDADLDVIDRHAVDRALQLRGSQHAVAEQQLARNVLHLHSLVLQGHVQEGLERVLRALQLLRRHVGHVAQFLGQSLDGAAGSLRSGNHVEPEDPGVAVDGRKGHARFRKLVFVKNIQEQTAVHALAGAASGKCSAAAQKCLQHGEHHQVGSVPAAVDLESHGQVKERRVVLVVPHAAGVNGALNLAAHRLNGVVLVVRTHHPLGKLGHIGVDAHHNAVVRREVAQHEVAQHLGLVAAHAGLWTEIREPQRVVVPRDRVQQLRDEHVGRFLNLLASLETREQHIADQQVDHDGHVLAQALAVVRDVLAERVAARVAAQRLDGLDGAQVGEVGRRVERHVLDHGRHAKLIRVLVPAPGADVEAQQ